MVPSIAVKEDDVPSSEIRDSLNKQFVVAFDDTGLPAEYLTEFVYALDHLDELMKTPAFPADRLLTTPDIVNYGDEAVTAFNQSTRRVHDDHTRHGVAVSQAVTDSLQEFIDRGYPKVINAILRALKIPGVDLSLDNEPRFIGIVQTAAHPHFCVLSYQDLGKRSGFSIPLLNQRLS